MIPRTLANWQRFTAIGVTAVSSLVLCLIIFAILFVTIILPVSRGWWLHHTLVSALDDATSVQVVEHSNPMDLWGREENEAATHQEIIYADLPLTAEQIAALRQALPMAWDYSGMADLICLFNDHHAIRITRRNGSVLTLQLCFICGELVVDGGPKRIMPSGWHSSLSKFMISLGLHPKGPFPPEKKN